MRKYNLDKTVKQIKCNMCGKEITVDHGMVKEGIFSCEYLWGYFSEKDGEKHSFDLCESCYDRMTEEFCLPIEKSEATEMI